jgi:hypothetical protein
MRYSIARLVPATGKKGDMKFSIFDFSIFDLRRSFGLQSSDL